MKIHQGFKNTAISESLWTENNPNTQKLCNSKNTMNTKGLETYTEMLNLLRKQIHVNKKINQKK